MYKILLTGHTGSYNRGCEAIVRGTIDLIKQYENNAQIILLSLDADSDRELLLSDYPDLKITDMMQPKHRKYTIGWVVNGIDQRLIQRYISGMPSYYSLRNWRLYKSSHAVISIGGDMFTDDYGVPSHVFGELLLARIMGSLTVIWAASIGPFLNKNFEKKWAKRLRDVDLITVREPTSYEYLQKIGVNNNVKLVADPAFLLPITSPRGEVFHRPRASVCVGFGMSAIVSKYAKNKDDYFTIMSNFGRNLISKGIHIVIIPHVCKKDDTNDDEAFCMALFTTLKETNQVTLISGALTASQLKGVIAQCDYFIGARTHSTIASMSSYVPTLSIAYSQKAYGLNRDIFGHANYVLPISDVSLDNLESKFSALCSDREYIISQLKQKIPVLIDRAKEGGVALAELLARRST